jgi:hypothetical protein
VQGFAADKTVCSTSVILQRFGSWTKALERAGLKKNSYTIQEIIEQLRDHYERNGKITAQGFAADKTVCSTGTVLQRFGSWTKALERAGLKKIVIPDKA